MKYNIVAMNLLKKNVSRIILLAFLVVVPVSVLYAANNVNCDPAGGKICPPINQTNLNDFIKTLLEGALKVGIPIIALAIIYCGFLFVSARGNSEKLGKAKSSLMYTLIGAAILLGSWAIAITISETVLGISK